MDKIAERMRRCLLQELVSHSVVGPGCWEDRVRKVPLTVCRKDQGPDRDWDSITRTQKKAPLA
jgi:hypothetical protein